MISAIEYKRSEEPPSLKRPKLEEETSSKLSNDEPRPADDSSYDSDDWETLSDDFRLLDEEWDKSGGFDVDLSKLRHTFGYGSVDLDESDLASNSEEPYDTNNRDFLNRLSKMAISHYHENTDTRLELVKVLRANFHPSAAITLYITFEAYDLSDVNNQTKRYQAVVRYLPWDIKVCSCWPAPSAS
ncbi:PREDICTED: uncharacterized protein LOC104708608 [Camelina sativa]|uniref:Uncharacterized protein LOC104708608 n=1 Tax=Camelina sativa TaxID=90675 RepID=A0ABM0TAZ9_CAMSA|nr:PREDICTED: uncharacterized protein LOC104708608 [Camelina sativa]